MIIGGWQKYSTIDFPGKLATVIFTRGCNFRCPYCHNGQLWFDGPTLPLEELFSFFDRRRGQVDGLVISGGEPTLQPDLLDFLERARTYPLALKLDTNGSNDSRLAEILDRGLVDFVAMDLKHIFDRYRLATGCAVNMDRIRRSMDLLLRSSIDYEFRTTVLPAIHSLEDIRALGPIVKGARRFSLQTFVPDHAVDRRLRDARPFEASELEPLRDFFASLVGRFEIK